MRLLSNLLCLADLNLNSIDIDASGNSFGNNDSGNDRKLKIPEDTLIRNSHFPSDQTILKALSEEDRGLLESPSESQSRYNRDQDAVTEAGIGIGTETETGVERIASRVQESELRSPAAIVESRHLDLDLADSDSAGATQSIMVSDD